MTTTTGAGRTAAEETMRHTPGPWVAYPNGTVGKDRTPMFSIGFGISGQLGEVVGDANARLIAAAPELLAALKAVQPYVAGWHDKDVGKQVVEALARAEGRAG